MTDETAIAEPSPWPHRWAWLLCGLTFPLLWVGQLVTTTDAGMAVPDWPNTFGYNLFLYPMESWLLGPWDLFIEHGHRLLASLVGLVTIGLMVVVWRNPSHRRLRGVAVAALALVLLQGVLGGVRVLGNDRLVAMLHGCTGPMFFALTCVIVVLTSANRQAAPPAPTAAARLRSWAAFATGLLFFQLTLGASLRHVGADAGPWSFAMHVKLHLATAGVVLASVLLVAWRASRLSPQWRAPRRLGRLLGLLVFTQVGLGVATWLAKYRTPRWASDWLPATIEPIVAGGWGQTHTVTAHSAIGALLLGLMASLAAVTWRAVASKPSAATAGISTPSSPSANP